MVVVYPQGGQTSSYVFHFIVVLHDEIVETFCICTDWIEESGDLLDWVVASQDINYLLAFNVKIPAARVRLLPEIFR